MSHPQYMFKTFYQLFYILSLFYNKFRPRLYLPPLPSTLPLHVLDYVLPYIHYTTLN